MKLPKGWIEKNLEEIADWGSGGTPKSTVSEYYDGNIPWLIINDLNDGYIKKSKRNITELGLKNSSAKIVDPENILIAMYGSIGKLGINKIPLATNQAIAFTKKLYGIFNKFLFFYLLFSRPNLYKLGKGGTQLNISQTVLKKVPIVIPPLPEQHRIVQKIEELFSELDNGVKQLQKAKEQIKTYRQSVLKAAFEGKLTHNNLKDGVLPKGWREEKLNDLCELITDGDHQAPPKSNQGIPFIVISNLRNGKIDFSNTRFVTKSYYEKLSDKRKPKKGDILYTVTGSFGIPISVNFEKEFCFQRHIGLIRPQKEMVENKYLTFYLSSNSCYKQALSVATGTAQKTVPLKGLRNFVIPVPTAGEQKIIVSEIEERFSVADKLEENIDKSLQQAEVLRQSILKKAFEGKLVPQSQKPSGPKDLSAEQASKTGEPVEKL